MLFRSPVQIFKNWGFMGEQVNRLASKKKDSGFLIGNFITTKFKALSLRIAGYWKSGSWTPSITATNLVQVLYSFCVCSDIFVYN